MNWQAIARITAAGFGSGFMLISAASPVVAQSVNPAVQAPSASPILRPVQTPPSTPPLLWGAGQPAQTPPTGPRAVQMTPQTPPMRSGAVETPPTGQGAAPTMSTPASPAASPTSESLLDDVVKGFGEGFATAVVVLVAAAATTAKLTALWDMRKKRNELDIALARDFYKLVGLFKAVAREGGALGSKPASPPDAVSRWITWHEDLTRRAIQAESDMEALLLNLVSEGATDEGLEPAVRVRRLKAAGLLRVAFRSLREQIEEGQMRQPGFGDPLFWLMNRIEGELSRHIFARATRVPRSYAPGTPPLDSADFLTLVSYRTVDLDLVAARLGPDVANYIDLPRQRARSTAPSQRHDLVSHGPGRRRHSAGG